MEVVKKSGRSKAKKAPSASSVTLSENFPEGQEIALDPFIDALIEEKAVKNNLTVFNVKSLIREVIQNEMVRSMISSRVKQRKEDGKSDETNESLENMLLPFEPKLTRAKTKELSDILAPLPWPISPAKLVTPKSAPSETQILMTTDLPESEGEDDEYVPLETDFQLSDDDSISVTSTSEQGSPSATSSGNKRKMRNSIVTKNNESDTAILIPESDSLFKAPSPRRKLKAKNTSAVGLRTRSKHPLTDTPLEVLEKELIPPDFSPDMLYWGEGDNEDYLNFLKAFTAVQGLGETGDDEEGDPEYNVMEEEEDETDREEHRVDRAVKVSKKELNELMTELFDGLESGDELELIGGGGGATATTTTTTTTAITTTLDNNEEETTRDLGEEEASECLENTVLVVEESSIIYENKTLSGELVIVTPVPLLFPTIPPPPLFNEAQIHSLRHQLQQHVQLLAQTYVLTSSITSDDSSLKLSKTAKDLLLTLDEYSRGTVGTIFSYIQNLNGALKLFGEWPLTTQKNSPIKKKILKEQFYNSVNFPKSSRFSLSPYELSVIKLMGESRVFMYPELLPDNIFPTPPECTTKKQKFSESEDCLIVRGMEQLSDEMEKEGNSKKKTYGLPVVSELIAANLLPSQHPTRIYHRLKNMKKTKQGNCLLKKYFQDKVLPPVPCLKILPEVPIAPIDRNEADLSKVWNLFITKLQNPSIKHELLKTKLGCPRPKGCKKGAKKVLKSSSSSKLNTTEPTEEIQLSTNESLGQSSSSLPEYETCTINNENGKPLLTFSFPKLIFSQTNHESNSSTPLINIPNYTISPIKNSQAPVISSSELRSDPPSINYKNSSFSPIKIYQSSVHISELSKMSPSKNLEPTPTLSPSKINKTSNITQIHISDSNSPSKNSANNMSPRKTSVINISSPSKNSESPSLFPSKTSLNYNSSNGEMPSISPTKTCVASFNKISPWKPKIPSKLTREEFCARTWIPPKIYQNRKESEKEVSLVGENFDEEEGSVDVTGDEESRGSFSDEANLSTKGRGRNYENKNNEYSGDDENESESECLMMEVEPQENSGDKNSSQNEPDETQPSSSKAPSSSSQEQQQNSTTSTTTSYNIAHNFPLSMSRRGNNEDEDDDEEDDERNNRRAKRLKNEPSDAEQTQEQTDDVDESSDEKNKNGSKSDNPSPTLGEDEYKIPKKMRRGSTTTTGGKERGSSSSQKRQSKYNTASMEQILSSNSVKHDEVIGAYADIFILNVRQRIETKNPTLFNSFMEILEESFSHDTPKGEVIKRVEELLKDYPDIVEEFTELQNAETAIASGNYTEFYETSAQICFIVLLEKWTENCPQLKSKILQKLKLLQSETSLTEDKIMSVMQPLFSQVQNPFILDSFKALFPSIFRPQNVFCDTDFEEIEIDDDKTETHGGGVDNSEIVMDNYEVVKLPEETQVIATNTCPCTCHADSTNMPFYTRAKHCKNCCLKFQDGKVFVHSGRVMKPVSIEYSSSELTKQILAPSTAPPKTSSSPSAAAPLTSSITNSSSHNSSEGGEGFKNIDGCKRRKISPSTSSSSGEIRQIGSTTTTNAPLPLPPPPSSGSTTQNSICTNKPWTLEEDRSILNICQGELDIEVAWGKIERLLPQRNIGEIKRRFLELINIFDKITGIQKIHPTP